MPPYTILIILNPEKLTDADEGTNTQHKRKRKCLHDSCLTQKRRLNVWHFIIQRSQYEWRQTGKGNMLDILPAAKKLLVSDKIKTQCDQWATLRASGKWTAFLYWLLNCCRLFLLLQDDCCSGAVINNDLCVCVCSLSAVQRSSDSCFAMWTGLNDTPHITSALSGKARRHQPQTCVRKPRRPQCMTAKGQSNTNRNFKPYIIYDS